MTGLATNLPVDKDRLWSDLMGLAGITDPDRPYTRRSFSQRFLEGRDWLQRRFTEAGLQVRIDAGGNLIGRFEGNEPNAGTIMIGSHSDTVPSGGRFDGVAGVVAGLEIARSLHESGARLRHAIEIVDFLAEEPSEFGLSCVGSRAMTGMLADRHLAYRNPSGERLDDAIKRIGGNPDGLAAAKRDDVAAYFELHIEQGVVLEAKRIDIGIVSAIVGIARVEIVFEGRADHAGATPMDLRRDAGVAAALTASFVAKRANREAQSGRGHFVATCGILEQQPNAANVVPGQSRLVFDIRAEDHMLTERLIAALDRKTLEIADTARVKRASWTVLSDSHPAVCAENLRTILFESAKGLGFSTLPMASGAGHDAAFMTQIAPSAMVFIPCNEGRSHAPEEWAEPAAIAAGASVIFHGVLKFDKAHDAA